MRFVIGHDHPALPGHFPGQPVVPGVVLLDRVLEAVEREAGEERVKDIATAVRRLTAY